MFELGEVVPLFIPLVTGTGEPVGVDLQKTLHFTFNCASDCLRPEVRPSADFPHAPLILTVNAFIIKRTSSLVRPLKEFTRNYIISVKDTTRTTVSVPLPPSPLRYRPSETAYDPSRPTYSPERPRRASKRKNTSSKCYK